MSPELSVIVPVYNEERGLPLLFARLYPALEALAVTYEVVWVDDGSSDHSVACLRADVAAHPATTRLLTLARNVGQHMAVLAGFEHARGRSVVTLDADLQNPPEEIGRLLEALRDGADYVGTIRLGRRDAWWRRIASGALNRIRRRTTQIRITDQGCMLRAYDRSVVDRINACREVNAFVPALGYAFAARPVELVVRHEDRAAGASKYSLYRLLRLNFDLMTGFSVVPLQLCSLAGILVATASLVFVAYLAVRRMMFGPEAEGVFTLFGIAFFLLGSVLFALGVVGEYIGRIYQQVRGHPRYVVASLIGSGATDIRPTASGAERVRHGEDARHS